MGGQDVLAHLNVPPKIAVNGKLAQGHNKRRNQQAAQ
jgi:hypothetical protein